MSSDTVLRPDRNCWQVTQADRLAFLVDAQEYFRAFVESARQARHSIFLLGWDFHSQVRLTRDQGPESDPTLKAFLDHLVAAKQSLRIYMLEWDYAEIFALEREFLPAFKLDWKTHRHFHFQLDDRHPVGASHHQKVVVVDDRVAFVGGLDLTKCRWDTPEHKAEDPRRTDPDGRPYRPFHDVQAVVSGEAAARLGELARSRWERATGTRVEAVPATRECPWPQSVETFASDLPVGIARTQPPHLGDPAIREIASFHSDAIAAARDYIYIENQYLTAPSIGQALEERLREEDGPEVVLVLPLRCSGRLEQSTMGVLRERLLRGLRAADVHDRLRVYYPKVPGLNEDHLNVHSKILVTDDRLVKVGSSNLSNRSLGFDTECDLIMESRDGKHEAAVTALLHRLLAEHLGTSEDEVARARNERGSLLQAVESLRGEGRTLAALEPIPPTEWEEWTAAAAELADPGEPMDMAGVAQDLLSDGGQGQNDAGHARLKWLLLGGTLLLLAAAWRWTPLGGWLTAERVGAALHDIGSHPFAPALVIAAFLVGGLLAAPVTLLIAATSFAFASVPSLLYSLSGIAVSATATYGVGRLLGRDSLRRLAGARINRVNRFLSRRGLWATIAIRNLPVAPFSVVNVIAGASHIRFRDYLLGTLIGMAPGTLAIVLLEESITEALQDPGPVSFAVVAALLGLVGAGAWGLRRWLGRRQDLTR